MWVGLVWVRRRQVKLEPNFGTDEDLGRKEPAGLSRKGEVRSVTSGNSDSIGLGRALPFVLFVCLFFSSHGELLPGHTSSLKLWLFTAINRGFLYGSVDKESACNARDTVWCLGQEDPLEEGMATHSSLLAWKTPWTVEPGGLQSLGFQRVGHTWATSTFSRVNSPAELLGRVVSSYHSSVGACANFSCFRRFITLPSQNLRFVTLSLFSLCYRHKLWLYFLSFWSTLLLEDVCRVQIPLLPLSRAYKLISSVTPYLCKWLLCYSISWT